MNKEAEKPINKVPKQQKPPGAETDQNGDASKATASGDSTPQRYGKAPIRKRMKETQARPSNRNRSPRAHNNRRQQEIEDRRRSRSPVRATSPDTQSSAPARKRPGAGSRIDDSARRHAEDLKRHREQEQRREVTSRNTGSEAVASHYNLVPQRGREWRKTDSNIRGLRSFNNWIKSALIQKFSTPDAPVQNLLVLDIGCGKGGDLQKWQAAPQTPALYVGLDPAGVSIDQAKDRYEEMRVKRRRGRDGKPIPIFDAQFHVQDCFGQSIGNIPVLQQVGFDLNAGPDANGHVIMGRPSRGGFDVVSMMFCLHYSYESEAQARMMLKNVAGALKKGGRFLGVLPSSDVLSTHVEKHLRVFMKGEKTDEPKKADQEEKSIYDDDWDPEKATEEGEIKSDDWDPTKSSAPAENEDDNWDPEKPSLVANGEDDWDPTKSTEPQASEHWNPEQASESKSDVITPKTPQELPPLEWGNSIYKVKFPQTRPLPVDGVFRPPYGWKYFYYLEEAVDVPEYVVPWEGFRALAEDYGLELQFKKSFEEVWSDYKDDRELGPLAERMGVYSHDGKFNVSPEEMEAAGFYHAFCFYKI